MTFLKHFLMTWKSFFILVKLFVMKILVYFVLNQIYYLFNFVFFLLTVVLQVVVIILLQLYFILTYCIPSRSRDPLLKSKIKRKKLELVDKISSKPFVLALDLDSIAVMRPQKFSRLPDAQKTTTSRPKSISWTRTSNTTSRRSPIWTPFCCKCPSTSRWSFFRTATSASASRSSTSSTLRVGVGLTSGFVLEIFSERHYSKKDGAFKKDLKISCGDIRKVLIVDHDEDNIIQKENHVPVSKFSLGGDWG